MIEITSSKNPLIKDIKGLYRKKDRWSSRSYIIEGIKIIEEAIENKVVIHNIIYTDKLHLTYDGENFINKLSEFRNLVYVPENLFKEISDTDNPQGVLAIVSFNLLDIEEVYRESDSYLVFLDGIQDPGNMGTIIRTADAFKVDGIILGEGSVDPYNPKVVRATMGSIFRVPLYFISNNNKTLLELKKHNYNLLATSLEGSVPIYDLNYNAKNIVIIGNEARGVDIKIIELTDKLIKIPMPGEAESLNAGVAASIIMYEAMRQRVKKP